jgi:biotin operon repressor
MLADRTMQVRSHILSLLESGKLQAGERLPSARDLATELGISFIKVQQAIETLSFDGIIDVRSRVGAFVQAGWQERVLVENLSIFNRRDLLPWLDGLTPLIEADLPGLRFTHHFRHGVLEMRTTLPLQMHHDEYLDLQPIFDELFPRKEAFFQEPFAPFRIDGRLIGIPFIFSPRVVCYQPQIFDRYGIPQPTAGWTWEAFESACRRLSVVLPVGNVLNWNVSSYYWLNLVLRSGGGLLANDDVNPVRVDDPRTVAALQRFQALGKLLAPADPHEKSHFIDAFCEGEAAMALADRQFQSLLRFRGAEGWKTVPLPTIPGGRDVTSQATDLICVRKSCTNLALVRTYVKCMLSERVQDYMAEQRYGIPIRRSSAFSSLDYQDANDAVVIAEMAKLGAEPCVRDPALARQVFHGVEHLLASGADLTVGLPRLASAARIWSETSHYLADRERERASPAPILPQAPVLGDAQL